MAVQDRVFSLATKVLRVISLKNVLLWTFAALVVLIGYTAYEQRAVLTNFILNGPEAGAPTAQSFTVSDTSKNRLKQLVNDNLLINAAVILNADIRNNRRIPIHWYSDDSNITRQLDVLYGSRYGGIPLFTSDEKNNENIVGVINGEFSCNTYEEGGNTAMFPGLNSAFPYICRTSLPPYYGQFSGYISISLNRTPTPSELDTIKAETLSLATEIYFRDVLPQNRTLAPGR